ncbi:MULTISPECIES: PfkB family carbohydrate kinase [unclassified Jeotgalibaca]|uniref:PfkB family carbohydrate kinase n=1 Tax=unclassified Jeotgalibaca TaxID=2621505 RepID=UPI003FD5B34E
MTVTTFGEVMMRLKPPTNERILQAHSYEATYGGAEANVATSLALLGDTVSFITKLPNNLLGEAALSTLRRYGVGTHNIILGGNRLGLYFFEKGASVRATNVVYDRANSAFATATADEFDWPTLLKGTKVFYFSGVTAAVSKELAEAILSACHYCQENDIQVVCDLNYRGKMWTPEASQAFMNEAMQYVTICLAHDEDFESSLGIKAFDGDMTHGIAQKDQYEAAMKEITTRFPNCHTVASVLRNIHSVEDSEWMAMLYRNGTFYETKTYQMHIMEGVASGDAFGAGFVHSLLHNFDPQETVQYALAACVLKLTITGDLNLVSDAEIRAIMGDGDANVKR